MEPETAVSPSPGDGHAPSLQSLPLPVRVAIVNCAADTLGRLPPAEVPARLLRVARFTPAKRARLGAAALAQAVESEPAFRAAVAESARSRGWAAGSGSTPSEAIDAVGAAVDPVLAAAGAHLLRLPTEAALVAAVREQAAVDGSPSESAELRGAVRQLQRELGRVRAERDDARTRLDATGGADEELDELRRRLRRQGTRLREAERIAEDSARQATQEAAELRGDITRLTGEVSAWQERSRAAVDRADRVQESLRRLREGAGSRRAVDDRRLELLLGTAEGAIAGLRREWYLVGGGADPADVLAERLGGSPPVAESTSEPPRLYSWLVLPSAHLIVDGYNVSKTGYPELTLAQQRDRLVRSISALAARTAADVTVVFDGAAVAVPAAPRRGVRVLFSPPGVIADDVIRDLVAAEPAGRVVIVVSSDGEVVQGVRRRGARTAASTVLLALLG